MGLRNPYSFISYFLSRRDYGTRKPPSLDFATILAENRQPRLNHGFLSHDAGVSGTRGGFRKAHRKRRTIRVRRKHGSSDAPSARAFLRERDHHPGGTRQGDQRIGNTRLSHAAQFQALV